MTSLLACGEPPVEDGLDEEVTTPIGEAAAPSDPALQSQAAVVCPEPFSQLLPGCDTCGDGLCELPETPTSCPIDCFVVPSCGDGTCNGSESSATCPQDCGTSCGDGVCNGRETPTSCEVDCGSVQDPAFRETILQDGGTWQLKSQSGSALDESTGQVRSFSENYWVIRPEGISSAPISATIRQELQDQIGDPGAVLTLSQNIINDIDVSIAQGYLTPTLAAIAQPADGGGPLPVSGPLPKGFGDGYQAMGSCSDQIVNKSKSFSVSTPLNFSTNPGGGFSGTLSASGNIQANATGEIQIAIKRAKVLWWCIPYGARFKFAHAYGTATVGYGSTVTGTISYAHSWEWQLAKIPLFSLNFWIGPIPVHIGFNLPINMGLDLSASATGSVTYTGSQSATGSFNYTCTLGGCSGSASYTQTNPVSPQIGTAGVSGRIQPNVWIQGAIRGYLYNEWIAYAQLGVRPYLRGDLWGYYGNNCGDANADGIFETVDALALDLDLQVHLTAQAAAFGGNPTKWNDLWHTPRYHLGYWDLIGSDAISPLMGGSSTASPNVSQAYTARMRPCYPWTDNVSYRFAWGDGTTTNVSGAPQTNASASHAWTTTGTKAASLTALSDAHGRTFNKATARNISVSSGTWTAWLNRDAPSGNGDYETRADFVPAVCASPLAIQCQTTAGVDWTLTGEVYSCTPSVGGVCINANQPDGSCMDYRVRFLCP